MVRKFHDKQYYVSIFNCDDQRECVGYRIGFRDV